MVFFLLVGLFTWYLKEPEEPSLPVCGICGKIVSSDEYVVVSKDSEYYHIDCFREKLKEE